MTCDFPEGRGRESQAHLQIHQHLKQKNPPFPYFLFIRKVISHHHSKHRPTAQLHHCTLPTYFCLKQKIAIKTLASRKTEKHWSSRQNSRADWRAQTVWIGESPPGTIRCVPSLCLSFMCSKRERSTPCHQAALPYGQGQSTKLSTY